MKRFMAHPWPGNVRELRNTIESVAVLATGSVLEERDALEAGFGDERLEVGGLSSTSTVSLPNEVTLAEAERTLIAARMQMYGSRAEVAKSLGIGLRTLYSKLAKLDPDCQIAATHCRVGSRHPALFSFFSSFCRVPGMARWLLSGLSNMHRAALFLG